MKYDVVTCGSARDAVALFQEQWRDFDLVLLDLVLPEMSGKAVFDAMRRTHSAARIVLFSGYSAGGEARAMLECGALGFLQKPFTAAQLAEMVAAALAPPRKSTTIEDPADGPEDRSVRLRADS